jgi:hypothetical protein
VRRDGIWRFSEARYDMLTADRWPLTEDDIFRHFDHPADEGSPE